MLFSTNIVSDEVERVIFHGDDLKKLNQVGALVGLIAVFTVTIHLLGVSSILFGTTDRGDIHCSEIALLSCAGINMADVPARVAVVVSIEDEVDTVFFE